MRDSFKIAIYFHEISTITGNINLLPK